ncbi:hypothetical protein PHLGIDRAFT_119785 [Phlebiopsis gigantea 11061_1 CR5-6]|uniref:Uncharacterized protein n=1 Tax=Phlebiopsis gigantea (strain 11061_1 CR5-6) TaxID=745531 RepID=A0A0C3S5A2_PHLG1|nr:hypothetical protein PHLGIDRAFT_119785 [Phlebiopsis gigantea 11061_1 CR5-6]
MPAAPNGVCHVKGACAVDDAQRSVRDAGKLNRILPATRPANPLHRHAIVVTPHCPRCALSGARAGNIVATTSPFLSWPRIGAHVFRSRGLLRCGPARAQGTRSDATSLNRFGAPGAVVAGTPLPVDAAPGLVVEQTADVLRAQVHVFVVAVDARIELCASYREGPLDRRAAP